MVIRVIVLWIFFLATPSFSAGFLSVKLAEIDDAIEQAITDGRAPGGVFHLEREGEIYTKAYGSRALVPGLEKMTVNTIFDAASLTKVVATTPAIMKLIEGGKLELDSPVSRYLPEFTGQGKELITIRHLMTHTSALRAGLSIRGDWAGKAAAYEAACAEPLRGELGKTYRYSDINFILLGLLVEKVSGVSLDQFCEREIFAPLGMSDCHFRPLADSKPAKLPRIAPTTEMKDGSVLRGVVHDPTARRMGGVAGHAGLFLTTRDLARYARMYLNGGELEGKRIFKEETVTLMTSVQSPAELPRRGLGWDIDSPYAGPRGALFPVGSFGHTGWTGTRLWIDPYSRSFVIFLSNRNHPTEKGNVIGLQRELGTLSALAIADFDFTKVSNGLLPLVAGYAPKPAAVIVGKVQTGIDVLKRENFRQLRGRRVGLITNHTGIDGGRTPTIDLLHGAPGMKLVALFSPEHGIRGTLDHGDIKDGRDVTTGLPVYSLYGKNRRPTKAQLAGIDTLVFDIQDIGCRFYTYISTMAYCLEVAGKEGLRFVILDRPNPLGAAVDGPVLTGERSFVGVHEIPVRHGMTVGELARLLNFERRFDADLGVIRCEGGSPLQWFDAVGQPWINPSPNMRSLTAAMLYPGVGLLEFCKLSVGRGTGTPFELLGAPYIDDGELAAELNKKAPAGVRFVPTRFTPDASVYSGEECRGVRILLIDRDKYRSSELNLHLSTTLHRLYGEKLDLPRMDRLMGDKATLDAILDGKSPDAIQKITGRKVPDFMGRRKPFLLYPR
ncbi:exo-beta-N-acetylmuramidase NamZ domain-containing protein [Verrucomicrobiaceae bacterium 227]